MTIWVSLWKWLFCMLCLIQKTLSGSRRKREEGETCLVYSFNKYLIPYQVPLTVLGIFFCLFSPFCMANSFILWVGAQILPPFWVVPDSVGYLFFLQWFYSILPIRHLLYVSCLYVILSHQTEHVKVGLIPLYIPFSFLLGTAHSTGHTGVTQQIFVGWMMARWTNSCWRFVQKCESGNSAPDCNRVGD